MIYITGDSFATGEELNDSKFPNYPGAGRITDEKKAKEWQTQRRKSLFAKHGTYHGYITECKKDSWGSMVAQYAGLPWMNSAISGGSMMNMLVNTQNDLSRLAREGKVVTHVYVMVTSPGRIALFKNEGDGLNPETNVESLSPGFDAAHFSHSSINYLKSWVAAEDESGMLCRWMMYFNAIRNTVLALAGVEPVFLDSMFIISNELGNIGDRVTTNLGRDMWEDVKPHFPVFEDRMSSYNCGDPLMPMGHYGWATHNRFAKALANRYHK